MVGFPTGIDAFSYYHACWTSVASYRIWCSISDFARSRGGEVHQKSSGAYCVCVPELIPQTHVDIVHSVVCERQTWELNLGGVSNAKLLIVYVCLWGTERRCVEVVLVAGCWVYVGPLYVAVEDTGGFKARVVKWTTAIQAVAQIGTGIQFTCVWGSLQNISSQAAILSVCICVLWTGGVGRQDEGGVGRRGRGEEGRGGERRERWNSRERGRIRVAFETCSPTNRNNMQGRNMFWPTCESTLFSLVWQSTISPPEAIEGLGLRLQLSVNHLITNETPNTTLRLFLFKMAGWTVEIYTKLLLNIWHCTVSTNLLNVFPKNTLQATSLPYACEPCSIFSYHVCYSW